MHQVGLPLNTMQTPPEKQLSLEIVQSEMSRLINANFVESLREYG
ncbi:MAG: hypothetical protein QNJ46_02890 [Leptolyngbyaceae cyanobacterium MO_188.B28]|nr:hypothetical protein [Leptolyngbyaceae cyanobacterium MO_188.B28]